MKSFKGLILSALIILSLTSAQYTTGDSDSMSANFSFTRSGSDTPLIQFKLNEDNTFEYIDKSNPSKQINTSGKYVLKGNKVKLMDYESEYKIPTTWKLDKNDPCIKTRKALKFTRICNWD